MRLFAGRAWPGLGLAAAVIVSLGVGAIEPVAAAPRAARKTVAKKAPAKKAPRKKPAPKKKKVVGLDLPPLPPGRSCYRADTEVPEPPLLKTAEIKVDDKARGGLLKSVLLVYEVTVDKSGRISEVRTIGERPKEPPWPQLHDAAIAALKQYKYAKTVVRGAAAPVCLMISLNVDLR
ncbi:MAG: hypothetical protein DMF83_13290 [Acidobacteria bacterium]|nr:MAG: hypothetical protein DMF83_13290 [Acidobacteriota bacterium]